MPWATSIGGDEATYQKFGDQDRKKFNAKPLDPSIFDEEAIQKGNLTSFPSDEAAISQQDATKGEFGVIFPSRNVNNS